MTVIRRLRAFHSGTAAGSGVSTYYCSTDSAPTTVMGDLQDFYEGIASRISTGYTFSFPGPIDLIEDSTGLIVGLESASAQDVVGTNATDVLANQTMLCLNAHTDVFVSGRELRGRTYLPGFCIDQSEDGQVLEATRSGVELLAQSQLEGGSFTRMVFSPTHLTSEPVNSHDVATEWCVLRSRRS